jgi:hypothetical protein
MLRHMIRSVPRKLDILHVFCPPRKVRSYETAFPGCDATALFHERELRRIIDEQKHRALLSGAGCSAPLPHVGVVLDSCLWLMMGDNDVSSFRYLMLNGRHNNFSIFMGTQRISAVFPKDLRSQVDIVAAFPEPRRRLREELRQAFLCGIFGPNALSLIMHGQGKQEALVVDFRKYPDHRPRMFMLKVSTIDLGQKGTEKVIATQATPPPLQLNFLETCDTETRVNVTFTIPIFVDYHNVSSEDGSVTLFTKVDALFEVLAFGKTKILRRQIIEDRLVDLTGLNFAYKTVAGAVTLIWAKHNILKKISILLLNKG